MASLKKRGYINTAGEWAVPPQYDLAANFSEGLAWVGAADLFGFVDPSGTETIPLMYQSVRGFVAGVAAVKVGEKWGYINRDNQFLIEPRFDGCVAGPFNEGLARVAEDERWGFINRAGEFTIEPQFEMAYDFHEGRAAVEIDGKTG